MNRSLLIGLCLLTVLIGWGLSWEMLRFQTGTPGLPAATVAVFYRFIFAGVLFAAFVIGRDWWRGYGPTPGRCKPGAGLPCWA